MERDGLIQYTGRLHRLHPAKAEVRIYDYVDGTVPMLRKMFEKRLRGYRAIGYSRDDAAHGLRAPRQEPVVEYDKGEPRMRDDGDSWADQ